MVLRSLIAGTVWIAIAAGAAAQSTSDKVTIRNVRIGFPAGAHAGRIDDVPAGYRSLFKAGAWTPVIVDVQITGQYSPEIDGPITASVETADSDDTLNRYSAPLPPFDPGGSASVMLFTRTGSRYGDITIRLTSRGRDVCRPDRRPDSGLDPNAVFYLAIGSRLPGLKLPGSADANAGGINTSEIGLVTRVSEMPTAWFGYGSADLVILALSDREFGDALINDTSGRRPALAEWVRRGGRLIVCAGRNRDQLAGAPEILAALPVAVGGPYVAPNAALRWREGGAQPDEPLSRGPIEFTRLEPRDGRPMRVLIDGPTVGAAATPLVVQGPYGLGRVTVLAFDPDLPPVRGWKNEAGFWEQLLLAAGPRPESAAQVNQFGFRPFGTDDADSVLRNLIGQLEDFESVPVISFGWVALFILIYILLVGPLDYLFLKRIVKRLELTWITFPLIVLLVSAGAYLAAHRLKGGELRINRVDVVDCDFQTRQIYGRSYFSIFSPRIYKYTVGLAAAEDWAAPPDDPAQPGTVMTWLGAPRPNRPSLFRSSYDYAPLATGLLDVPINVWSTKGFQAAWAAPFDRDQPPFAVSLAHPPGRGDDVIGSITNQLPVDLEDAVLIYRGAVAPLGTLLRGAARPVSAGERIKFSQWKSGAGPIADPDAEGLRTGVRPLSGNVTAVRLNLALLFHEAASEMISNGSLRDVDQSWRISESNRDEAILVARLPGARGGAEAINAAPANPARLWLGGLPTRPNSRRPTLDGVIRQKVYIRVLIPIASDRSPMK